MDTKITQKKLTPYPSCNELQRAGDLCDCLHKRNPHAHYLPPIPPSVKSSFSFDNLQLATFVVLLLTRETRAYSSGVVAQYSSFFIVYSDLCSKSAEMSASDASGMFFGTWCPASRTVANWKLCP